MENTAKLWYSLEIDINPGAEETVSSALWEEGTLGIVTASENEDSIKLLAYFDRSIDLEPFRARLNGILEQFGHSQEDLRGVNIAEVPNEDWLKKWKEGYEPLNVGERFLITPSWLRNSSDAETDRVVIEIDPGMAFGTGTHETTQLCLQTIALYWKGGNYLDVGTGTGILAIAAAKLHPDAFIAACDIDEEAVMVAKENAEINRVEKIIKFSANSADCYKGGDFSFITANLTADVIISLLDDLLACLGEGGRIALSGILNIQQEQVCDALKERGRNIVELRSAGEWVAIIVE